MSIREEVVEVIVEQLGVDPAEVDEGKSFIEDLNADSLDLTEMVMTLEERFGCEIAEEKAEKLRTVGDVIRYIEAARKEGQ